jgi:hypothetical protein
MIGLFDTMHASMVYTKEVRLLRHRLEHVELFDVEKRHEFAVKRLYETIKDIEESIDAECFDVDHKIQYVGWKIFEILEMIWKFERS